MYIIKKQIITLIMPTHRLHINILILLCLTGFCLGYFDGVYWKFIRNTNDLKLELFILDMSFHSHCHSLSLSLFTFSPFLSYLVLFYDVYVHFCKTQKKTSIYITYKQHQRQLFNWCFGINPKNVFQLHKSAKPFMHQNP